MGGLKKTSGILFTITFGGRSLRNVPNNDSENGQIEKARSQSVHHLKIIRTKNSLLMLNKNFHTLMRSSELYLTQVYSGRKVAAIHIEVIDAGLQLFLIEN